MRSRRPAPRRFRARRAILPLLILAALAVGRSQLPTGQAVPAALPTHAGPDDGAIEVLFEAQRSDVEVEASGIVRAVLRDDREGTQHQRFILSLDSGHTLLVAHNIDLAPRVPLERGDMVALRGEYEWNEQGGVVHWTHHDPAGRRRGGWIDHGGRRYE